MAPAVALTHQADGVVAVDGMAPAEDHQTAEMVPAADPSNRV